jgi:hypothetical protein
MQIYTFHDVNELKIRKSLKTKINYAEYNMTTVLDHKHMCHI